MTVYTVTNPNSFEIEVGHEIVNASGFSYRFQSRIPPNGAAIYHLQDLPQVPSPFQGSVMLTSDNPFDAKVVGYDYP